MGTLRDLTTIEYSLTYIYIITRHTIKYERHSLVPTLSIE